MTDRPDFKDLVWLRHLAAPGVTVPIFRAGISQLLNTVPQLLFTASQLLSHGAPAPPGPQEALLMLLLSGDRGDRWSNPQLITALESEGTSLVLSKV